MNYWHLELYSGEIIKVKPVAERIAQIQALIASQAGAITTPTRSIIIKDVKDFRLSDEPYIDKQLIESANTAFNEPTINEDGSVASRWVKKTVPRRRYDTFYRYNPAYKYLEDSHDSVVIAFRVPTHLIDRARVQDLGVNDEIRLSKII